MPEWLLVLGSNHGGEARIRAALQALSALGEATLRGGMLITAAEPAGGPDYANALAVLRTGIAEGEVLERELKGVEAALGRDRRTPGVVALDADVLALAASAGWRLTPRSRAKRELEKTYVRALLAAAGIVVEEPA
jgi:7,8-dihydro-6-hydroxymethylpterin-pyrophosphokinase